MTREQIEKKAKEWCKQYIECDGNCRWCPNERYKDYFIEGADWALSHQWVNVEDELPPQKNGDNESEYAFVKLTCGRLPWTACYSYEHQCWMDVNHQAIHSVTHWMPIPPIAEKGGEK